jgi:predicted nucleotide-binding protein (sugar kinase/HSP70/actin superfamily)
MTLEEAVSFEQGKRKHVIDLLRDVISQLNYMLKILEANNADEATWASLETISEILKKNKD